MRRSTRATSLVEEAMLAANEAVARRLVATELPCPFRVHEAPDHDSMAGLVGLLDELGCLKPQDRPGLISCDSHAVQAVLDEVAGKPEEELVSSLLLRAMKRATYEPENLVTMAWERLRTAISRALSGAIPTSWCTAS